MSQWATFRERVAGKWQIPLFVVSLAMLGGAFLRIRPVPDDVPPDVALGYLDRSIDAGLFEQTIADGHTFLALDTYTALDHAGVRLRLARAAFELGMRDRTHTAGVGRQITEHYERVEAEGLPMTGEDFRRLGWALEWQRLEPEAITQFERALAEGVDHASDLRWHTIMLRKLGGADPTDINEQLETFLAALDDHRLDLRVRAIELKLDQLALLDKLDDASTLAVREAGRFRESEFADAFAYIEALLMYKQGHFDEAEALLRTIRNRVGQTDEVHAKTGWLLGRTVLNDGGPQRPQEAVSFFRDVITHHPRTPYAIASRMRLAEALALVERHDEAIAEYRIAIDELNDAEAGAAEQLINRDLLRVSLGVMSQTQHDLGDLPAALDYAQLAVDLLDPTNPEQTATLLHRLGQTQELLAAQLEAGAAASSGEDGLDDDPSGSQLASAALAMAVRQMYADAATTFVAISKIETLNERRSADACWRAAELFTKAEQLSRAADLYHVFNLERPGHSLVPRALLRIGTLRQRMGDLPGAIGAYRACYDRFPRTIDGARALIPLARCYAANGPDGEVLAEKTLRVVLEDSELFTPQAPEFGDALFLLGEVHNRRHEFERAIGTLEEALDRYPDDPRVWQARSLLADSYRQSGLALKAEVEKATTAAEIEHIQTEARARLTEAREYYRMVIREAGFRPPDPGDQLAHVNLRHAYVYEADCYFEVGAHREALKRYEEAAGLFKDRPTSLAAYVQIINCHVFLGQPEEARAALARARILVEAIPQDAFDGSVSPETRKDWQRYFEWLDGTELF